MADGKRRYDIEERCIDFAVEILDLCDTIPKTRAGNHIAGQLVRCGTSPAPNYAESQAAESTKDFIHKLGISLKELRETRVWLKVIIKAKRMNRKDAALQLLKECNELISIFGASINTVKKRNARK